jgi:hypothetical protein
MYFERQHDPPHGGADPGYWQVHLAIDVYAITASEATTGATEFLEEHVMR